MYFYFDGKYYPEGTAILGANNRGLRYGDGLFETCCIRKGKIQWADEHFARLWKSMQIMHFDIPKLLTPDALESAVMALVAKNKQVGDIRVRITVLRGDGGLFDPVDQLPHCLIQSWALPENHGAWNSNGLVLGIYYDAVKSCDILSNLKHNNYLPYVMAALEAKKQKWNDAILLNSFGRVCDSAIANIFLIKDKEIITPALTEGPVAGIMRKQLLQALPTLHYSISERPVSLEDLENADEVFITNAMHPIRWIQRIGEKEYQSMVTREIYAAFYPTIC